MIRFLVQQEALSSFFISSCITHTLSGNRCACLFSCRSSTSFWSDITISPKRRVSRSEIHNEGSQILPCFKSTALQYHHFLCNYSMFTSQTLRLDNRNSADSSPSLLFKLAQACRSCKRVQNCCSKKIAKTFQADLNIPASSSLDNSSI